jgi:hypothetical protein
LDTPEEVPPLRFLPVLPFLLAAPLAAQSFAGDWHLATAPDVPAIIEAATAPMNFVTRPIARGKLKKTNPVYQRIRISRTPTEFVLQYDDRAPQHMPADGHAVAWTREDKEVFQISARVDKEDLIQHYQAEDGERTNVFHLDPATHLLTMEVTIKSKRLPGPVVYKITYK